MFVQFKDSVRNAYFTEEERKIIKPGNKARVWIHETYKYSQTNLGYFLIEIDTIKKLIYNGESELESGELIRLFEDKDLPETWHLQGPYMWVESTHCEIIETNTNKEASYLLKNSEWEIK